MNELKLDKTFLKDLDEALNDTPSYEITESIMIRIQRIEQYKLYKRRLLFFLSLFTLSVLFLISIALYYLNFKTQIISPTSTELPYLIMFVISALILFMSIGINKPSQINR